MSSKEPPTAMKLAERLLCDIELAVCRFPHRHKYTNGKDLREQAAEVFKLVNRAWRDRGGRLKWLTDLVWAVDELKLTMRIGQQIRAFRSLGQFKALYLVARQLGKQVGGWFKRVKERCSSIGYAIIHYAIHRWLQRGQNAARLHRQEAVTANSLWPVDRHRQRQGRLALPLRLRHGKGHPHASAQERRDPVVRLLSGFGSASSENPRHVSSPHLPIVGIHAGSLHAAQRPELQVLRRSGHHGLPTLDGVRELLLRHGQPARRHDAGAQGQPRPLRTRQLPLGFAPSARPQPAKQPAHHRARRNEAADRVVRNLRPQSDHRRHSLTARGHFGGRFSTGAAQPSSRHSNFQPSPLKQASYRGHLQHADTWRLRQQLRRQFPWVGLVRRRFDYRLEGRSVSIPLRSTA